MTRLKECEGDGWLQRQRVIATRVPSPGFESMENSFERRRAPLNPRPSPPPVV